jgi:hypothetical protein
MERHLLSFENYGQASSVSSIEHQWNWFDEKENMSAFPPSFHFPSNNSIMMAQVFCFSRALYTINVIIIIIKKSVSTSHNHYVIFTICMAGVFSKQASRVGWVICSVQCVDQHMALKTDDKLFIVRKSRLYKVVIRLLLHSILALQQNYRRFYTWSFQLGALTTAILLSVVKHNIVNKNNTVIAFNVMLLTMVLLLPLH